MAVVTCLKELYSEGHCNIVSLLIFNFYSKSPLHYFFSHYAVGFPSWFLVCRYFKTDFCRLSFLVGTVFFLHSQEVYNSMKNRLQNVHLTLTVRYRWGFQKYLSGEVSLALVGAGLTLCPLENSASFATAIANQTPYCHNRKDGSVVFGMLRRAYGYARVTAERGHHQKQSSDYQDSLSLAIRLTHSQPAPSHSDADAFNSFAYIYSVHEEF